MSTRNEIAEEWREWAEQLPSLSFPFPVRIVPPYAGALIRFWAGPNGEVSVYLDAFEKLGHMGEPYWELYPNEEGDTERFLLSETSALIARIEALLKEIK